MKLRSPKTRYHLTVRPGARILEVGGEKKSHPQANVVADVFSMYRKNDDPIFEMWNHQELVLASEDELPFDEDAFDYVICCQVLEHLDNPVPLLYEMSRVAKKGYVEVPSLVNEYMAPNPKHKWVCMEIDHKMVLMEKAQIGMDNPIRHFGSLFTTVLNEDSLAFKTFVRANQDIFSVRHEWEADIDFEINPGWLLQTF
jgi:SAM-dependent methyltransferase